MKHVCVDSCGKRELGTAAGMIGYQPGWDDPLTEEELETLMESCVETDSNCGGDGSE